MTEKKTYHATRSTISKNMLYIDGKPVSFYDYPFQLAIYDCGNRRIMQKSGRQLGKSTGASNFIIAECIAHPFFKTLYVSPTREQTSKFSSTRLSKTISYSPLIRNRFQGATDNVFLKLLSNGSEIALGYASDDPDRIRGITADRTFLDEVQDMQLDVVVPVIKETMANSDYALETYTGTPKSLENGIEWLWQQSTQTEWIMKCGGCSKWNYIASDKSIGKLGPICVSCGHLLDPRLGQWYDFVPEATMKGFHVSQPMLPKNAEDPERWERILEKLENYPPAKFNNEVLGISDAIGTRMISQEELEALCEDYTITLPPDQNRLKKYAAISAGIDWSGGGTQATSRTAVWIWGLLPNEKMETIYFKIFPGRNQVEDVREVAHALKACHVQLACGDAGEGAVANALVKEIIGQHRLYPVQYGSLAKGIKWNQKDRFIIDKTAFIDSFMLLLKRKGVVFPNLSQSKEAIRDVLNEYEEVTQNGLGRKVWRHAPNAPDDALQAMMLGWIAMRISRGDLKLYDIKGTGDD